MRHFGTPRPGVGWDIAGTAEHATEEAYAKRVQRDNARLEGARKRALWSNTKANRALYGVESEHARFRLYDRGEDAEAMYPDHCKRVAKVLAQAAFLPMHVEVGS